MACRKNNFEIVSILLNYKADYSIRDNNGMLPINITSDSLIKKRIIKTAKSIENINENQIILKGNIDQFSFIDLLGFVPPRPLKAVGRIQKMGKLILNYHDRYLEIDPVFGSLRRFEKKSLHPNYPLYIVTYFRETIPLSDIKLCKKIEAWYTSTKYYYFEVKYY